VLSRCLIRNLTIGAVGTASTLPDTRLAFSRRLSSGSASRACWRGITLKFSDAQGKQENQFKAIKSFVAQRVNAIILAPVVETGWEPVLRERTSRLHNTGHARSG